MFSKSFTKVAFRFNVGFVPPAPSGTQLPRAPKPAAAPKPIQQSAPKPVAAPVQGSGVRVAAR